MWRRYPNRLAHLEGDPQQIFEGGVPVGTRWLARCGRELRLFWRDRPGQTEAVSAFDLRLEEPRGWCLRCAYWAAMDALVLPGWNFSTFVDEVYAGRWPVTIGALA